MCLKRLEKECSPSERNDEFGNTREKLRETVARGRIKHTKSISKTRSYEQKVWKMPTITKKVLIDRIADNTNYKKAVVGKVVNSLFDHIVEELGNGNRIELRNFGVFEIRTREPRMAQNPKTLEPVRVEKKKVVKFKVGRLMKSAVEAIPVDTNMEMPVVETTASATRVKETAGV